MKTPTELKRVKPLIESRGPDVLYIRAQPGEVDVPWLAEQLREQYEKLGPAYIIADLSAGGISLGKESRDESSRLMKSEWMLGCIYVKASMPMRLALKAANLALFLLGKADYPSGWVDSEAEAMDCLAKFRAESARAA